MNAIPLINNAPKFRPDVNVNVNHIGGQSFNPVSPQMGNVMRQNPYGNETQLRQEVNTSIVALKREAFSLENLIAQAAQTLQDVNKRLSELEGKQGDYVKKSDVVDSITSGNMNPVTSNAVAEKISYDYADYTVGEVVYTIEIPYLANSNNTNIGSILINARYGYRYILDYYNFINEPIVATTNARIARLRMLDGGIDGGNYLEPTLKWDVDTTNKKVTFYIKKSTLNTTLSFKVLQEIKGINTVRFGKTTDLTVYDNASYSRAFEYLSPIDSVTSGSLRPVTSDTLYWLRRGLFYDTGLLELKDNQEKTVTLDSSKMYLFVNIHAVNGQELIILNCYKGTLKQTRITHAQGSDTVITNNGQDVTFKATRDCRGHLLYLTDYSST